MQRAHWALRKRRPHIEVVLSAGKAKRKRRLIADTGGGSDEAPFELILLERDCKSLDGVLEGQVSLRGAFDGWFNVYSVAIRIPQLGFEDDVRVVAVASVPKGFDGIASFKFLNRFHYGNFGDRDSFGLEK
jgi:hypothetical protein